MGKTNEGQSHSGWDEAPSGGGTVSGPAADEILTHRGVPLMTVSRSFRVAWRNRSAKLRSAGMSRSRAGYRLTPKSISASRRFPISEQRSDVCSRMQ